MIYRYANKMHDDFSYIGQTVFDRKTREGSECRRYNKCLVFKRAIDKYGIDSFEYSILEDNIPEEMLDEREQYWISYYHSYIGDPECKGYNMTVGGSTNRGRICRQETKDKTSRALMGHEVSEKAIQHIVTFNKSRKGIKPKNFDQALEAAHKASSKPILDLETGQVFDSKVQCAAYFGYTVSWVNGRLRGHKKCREEKFAEITSND